MDDSDFRRAVIAKLDALLTVAKWGYYTLGAIALLVAIGVFQR